MVSWPIEGSRLLAPNYDTEFCVSNASGLLESHVITPTDCHVDLRSVATSSARADINLSSSVAVNACFFCFLFVMVRWMRVGLAQTSGTYLLE